MIVKDIADKEKQGTLHSWTLRLFGESHLNNTIEPSLGTPFDPKESPTEIPSEPTEIPTKIPTKIPEPNESRPHKDTLGSPYFLFILILVAITVTIATAIYYLSNRKRTKRVATSDEEFERLVVSGDFDSIMLNDLENPILNEVLFDQESDY